MKFNKKINVILIIGIVILLAGIFVINNQPKETKELPRVKLKEQLKNKQFALMLEQSKGEKDYQESDGELPTEGYKFNKEKSGCVDINGKVVENALDYDYDNYTVLLDTSKTLYCYLYYDIADVKVYANLLDFSNMLSRYNIISASFVDYVPSEEELETLIYWDLSDTTKGTKENSVIGWLEETEEGTGQYNLYIGSKDEIYATDLNSAFYGMTNLKEIHFDNLNTSETTDMSVMFAYSDNLITLDLSTFDTSKVTNMSFMFQGISANITFPQRFGSSAIDMSYMFQEYKGTFLDLSLFDTSNVNDMEYMFSFSSNLSKLNLSGWDTSQVTDMSNMFDDCSNLTKLDLSSFDTSRVENMYMMFCNCYSLTTLDLSSFTFESIKEEISGYLGNLHSGFEATFYNVPEKCEVKIKSSQQAIFESKFPKNVDRTFTPTYVD